LLQQSTCVAKHGGEATPRQSQRKYIDDGDSCAKRCWKFEKNGQNIHLEISYRLSEDTLQ